MNLFLSRKRKQQRKQIEHAVFQVKYARRMKEDLLDPNTVAELRELQSQLKGHLKAKEFEQGLALAESAGSKAAEIHPTPDGREGLRENVEVFVVVMAVALAFRTYFLQPYQIPTGSMQPTLYGITSVAEYEPGVSDKLPMNVLKFLLSGSRYKEVKAKVDGVVAEPSQWRQQDTFILVPVRHGRSLTYHKIHKDMKSRVKPGMGVRKGEVLATGLLKQGDHIIVNRMVTNFRKPRRGDIVVFSTRGLPLERENSAYIKRLTGLPGETLKICDGTLYADGKRIEDPWVFQRQYNEGEFSDAEKVYPGYNPVSPNTDYFAKFQVSPKFMDCAYELTLGEDEYLMMGDNTDSSLDGRYFGGVPGENVLGIGFFVPWPFINRGIYNDAAGPVH